MSHTELTLAGILPLEALAGELRRNKRARDRWSALGLTLRTYLGRRVLYWRVSQQEWLLAQEDGGRGCNDGLARKEVKS